MTKKLTCLVCPRGCTLSIDENLVVTGNFCPRGIPYAISEMKNPTRMVTYSIKIKNRDELLPVRTDIPLDKNLIKEVTMILKELEVSTPIAFNQVIVANILDSGVNIIASTAVE